jgi:hypothetical protein
MRHAGRQFDMPILKDNKTASATMLRSYGRNVIPCKVIRDLIVFLYRISFSDQYCET